MRDRETKEKELVLIVLQKREWSLFKRCICAGQEDRPKRNQVARNEGGITK